MKKGNTMIKFLIIITACLSFVVKADCFEEVSQKYQIHPLLLKGMTLTESAFNGDALNCENSNGSCDYGFAQINLSTWKSKLKEFNISILDLQDKCQNLHFGAWVLAKNFESHGRNWNSVGAYNAGFKEDKQKAREIYIAKVKANIEKIRNWSQ